MIGHVRVVPDLGIAVEEMMRPELSSYPVIMGGLPEQHGVVREANILAQQIGVRAGMTLRQAHQLCPEGIFLIPDLPRYEGVWQQVCDALRIFTPLVESLQMGQAVLDLQGCERQFANSWEAARAVQVRVRNETGLMVWIGLASNRLVAQLVSMSPNSDGIGIVAIGKEREFLADLPLTVLPNVDSRLALTFQVLGLRTIGQFAALPAQAVRQRFGSAGETLHRYARGRDSRPVIARQALPSISMRQECDEGSMEEVVAALSSLAERCATELERQQLAGHLITIALIWGSGPSFFPKSCRLTPVIESNHHKALIATGPQPADSSNPPPSATEHSRALASPHSSVTRQNLPIDYRIHSMLPQPGTARSESSSTVLTVRNDEEPSPNKEFSLSPSTVALRGDEFKTAARAVARSAICSAVPLVEQGQRLVMQLWKTRPQGAEVVRALELTVSEFEPPSQLSFTEFNRVSETGGLAGLSPDRLNTLRRQEQLLSARYGDASFRHLADLDPGNTLAERRFQWRAGLPWPQPRSLGRRS